MMGGLHASPELSTADFFLCKKKKMAKPLDSSFYCMQQNTLQNNENVYLKGGKRNVYTPLVRT